MNDLGTSHHFPIKDLSDNTENGVNLNLYLAQIGFKQVARTWLVLSLFSLYKIELAKKSVPVIKQKIFLLKLKTVP